MWLPWGGGGVWEFLLKIKNTQRVTPAVPLENHSLLGTWRPIAAGLSIA